jgi:5-methylcytosine-specific restriction endonuclease McrA
MRLVDMQIAAARRKVDVAQRELRRHLLTAVSLRDGTDCHYCGCPTIELMEGHPRRRTLDHVIPQKFGGTDTLDNLVLACSACNSAKGARVNRSLLCPSCRGRTLEYGARETPQL